MSESGTSKRKRAANFTELETRILVDVVLRHIDIIENKRSDSITWKQKSDTWEIIANQFNSLTGSRNRPAKELRLKYEGVKRNIKKKQTHNKYEMHFKTGGGSPNLKDFTDYEEKILSHIMLTVEGLIAENDCDADLVEHTEPFQQEHSVNNGNTDQVINSLFTSAAFNVPTSVSSVTTTSGSQSATTVLNVQAPTVYSLYRPITESDTTVTLLSPCLPKTNNDTAINQTNFCGSTSETTCSMAINMQDTNPIEETKVPERTPQKWAKWSSSQLKQTKHKALATRTCKPIKKDALNEKIAGVTDARQELLVLQKKIAEEELIHKQEEHAERLKSIRLEQEGIVAEQEFLKRERQLKEELLHINIKNKKLKQQLLELQVQNLSPS